MLGFIDGVGLYNRKLNPSAKAPPLSSKELIYRRFLIFKELYTAPAPVVLCEGKTDNVYITHAIRSLAAQFPELADIDPKGKIVIKLRRFKYTGTSTGRILGIHGGSGDLKKFIPNYKKEVAQFKAPGMQRPIIILVDNDSGADSLLNTIKEITGKKPDRSDAYTHIVKNLYLVMTPIAGGATQSKIEDCFSDEIKSTVLGGKTFDSNNEFNTDTCYGKADFAYKVVRPNTDKIDFTGFKPVLDRFIDVIAAHEKRA
jgi:hypothetical protein